MDWGRVVIRWAVILSVVLVGCVATIPDDPTLTADLAVETAREIVRLRGEIQPTPTPPDSDQCENCEGRGYVGDGRVRVPCQPCGGTGKVIRHNPVVIQ